MTNINSDNDKETMTSSSSSSSKRSFPSSLPYHFEVTGLAGHARIAPLLPKEWIDISPNVVGVVDNGSSKGGGVMTATTTSTASGGDEANGNNDDDDVEINTTTQGFGSSNNDISTTVSNATTRRIQTTPMVPDFLWENCPRRETRDYRDNVKVYSHLPNGRDILDSKWVLGRLLSPKSTSTKPSATTSRSKNDAADADDDGDDPLLATLETHCFRGLDGYQSFCEKVQLIKNTTYTVSVSDDFHEKKKKKNDDENSGVSVIETFPDLYPANDDEEEAKDKNLEKKEEMKHTFDASSTANLWVIKDAMTNGAGGIWVIGPQNYHTLLNPETSPLYKDHTYVAQEYVPYPFVLFQQRKCHVRVYALMTSDGRAFVHHRAFLHVANDIFHYTTSSSSSTSKKGEEEKTTHDDGTAKSGVFFQDSVHITNCCANSHDPTKFAGEILADFHNFDYETKIYHNNNSNKNTGGSVPDQQIVVPLGPFFPSVCASIKALAQRTFPFLNGGQANNGFEYMGMDFILSYKRKTGSSDNNQLQPVAYLLEVNAPPSQETATQLQHAEELHNEVLQDLINIWVIPNVMNDPSLERSGGWICVYDQTKDSKNATTNEVAEERQDEKENNVALAPSKAVIINKIKWTIFERAAMKRDKEREEEDQQRHGTSTLSQDGVKTVATSTTNAVSSVKNHDNGTHNDDHVDNNKLANLISAFSRTQFPYFAATAAAPSITSCGIGDVFYPYSSQQQQQQCPQHEQAIFLENAGGSQVAGPVLQAVQASLWHRNRSVIGSKTKLAARETLERIVGDTGDDGDSMMFLGPNATTLLSILASNYVQLGLLESTDEIVISTENHLANVDGWVQAAQRVGATIKWWTPYCVPEGISDEDVSKLRTEGASAAAPPCRSKNLEELLSTKTRIVAISHASNVLGQLRDVAQISKLVASRTLGHAHLVVDGVAAAPHWFPCVSQLGTDWYVISCHKLFGPHLGGLYASGSAVTCFKEAAASTGGWEDSTRYYRPACTPSESLLRLFELGTVSYEACAGVVGLGAYLAALSSINLGDCYDDDGAGRNCLSHEQVPYQSSKSLEDRSVGMRGTHVMNLVASGTPVDIQHCSVSTQEICEAYSRIRIVEETLLRELWNGLSRSSKVTIIEGEASLTKKFSETTPIEASNGCIARLPVVGIVHQSISADCLLLACERNGIACRKSSFLCTKYLARDFGFDPDEGFLRISLAHYNTVREVHCLFRVLESLPGWF